MHVAPRCRAADGACCQQSAVPESNAAAEGSVASAPRAWRTSRDDFDAGSPRVRPAHLSSTCVLTKSAAIQTEKATIELQSALIGTSDGGMRMER